MLTQAKADELIALAKEAVRKDVLTWLQNKSEEEFLIATTDKDLQFILSFKRNPFEVKAHLRTRDRHISLARIDNAAQHVNPDGKILRGAHIHWYREGDGLAWAELIDWYDAARPMETLLRFLNLIAARFPYGLTEDML